MLTGITLTILFFLLISVIATIILGFTYLLRVPKKDKIETSETSALILVALYIGSIYMIFLIIYSIFQLNRFHYTGWSYQEIVISFVYVLPAFFAVFNYLNMNRYFKKKFGLGDVQEDGEFVVISNMSKALGLKQVPDLLISLYENIPPFVFGKAGKKGYLAIPRNWKNILDTISEGNKVTADNLEKLVLTHELSHIKNRDHIFMGWSHITLKTFNNWICLSLPVTIVYIFQTDQLSFRFTFGPLLVGIIYYFYLHIITMSVSRKREYFADARASILFSKEELESIS